MLVTIAIILLILWLLGAVVVPVSTGAIHVLLVVALILVLLRLVNGRALRRHASWQGWPYRTLSGDAKSLRQDQQQVWSELTTFQN